VLACAQTALLNWCNDSLAPLLGSNTLEDFTTCWQSGVAFNALLHFINPQLVDWSSVHHGGSTEEWAENLHRAFHLAEHKLKIPRLLDVQEIAMADEEDLEGTSIMLYVSMFYHHCTHSSKLQRRRRKKSRTSMTEKERLMEQIRKRSHAAEAAAAERDARLKLEGTKRIFRHGVPYPEASTVYTPVSSSRSSLVSLDEPENANEIRFSLSSFLPPSAKVEYVDAFNADLTDASTTISIDSAHLDSGSLPSMTLHESNPLTPPNEIHEEEPINANVAPKSPTETYKTVEVFHQIPTETSTAFQEDSHTKLENSEVERSQVTIEEEQAPTGISRMGGLLNFFSFSSGPTNEAELQESIDASEVAVEEQKDEAAEVTEVTGEYFTALEMPTSKDATTLDTEDILKEINEDPVLSDTEQSPGNQSDHIDTDAALQVTTSLEPESFNSSLNLQDAEDMISPDSDNASPVHLRKNSFSEIIKSLESPSSGSSLGSPQYDDMSSVHDLYSETAPPAAAPALALSSQTVPSPHQRVIKGTLEEEIPIDEERTQEEPMPEKDSENGESDKAPSEVDIWFANAEQVEELIVKFSSELRVVIEQICNQPDEQELTVLDDQFMSIMKEVATLKSDKWITFVEDTFTTLHKYQSRPSFDFENQTPVSAGEKEEPTVIKLTFATIENKWNKLWATITEGDKMVHQIKDERQFLSEANQLRDLIQGLEAGVIQSSSYDKDLIHQWTSEVETYREHILKLADKYPASSVTAQNLAQVSHITASLDNLEQVIRDSLKKIRARESLQEIDHEVKEVDFWVSKTLDKYKLLPAVAEVAQQLEESSEDDQSAALSNVKLIHRQLQEEASMFKQGMVDGLITLTKSNDSLEPEVRKRKIDELQKCWQRIEKELDDAQKSMDWLNVVVHHLTQLNSLEDSFDALRTKGHLDTEREAQIEISLKYLEEITHDASGSNLPSVSLSIEDLKARYQSLQEELDAFQKETFDSNCRQWQSEIEDSDFWLSEIEAELGVGIQRVVDQLKENRDFSEEQMLLEDSESKLSMKSDSLKSSLKKMENLLRLVDKLKASDQEKEKIVKKLEDKKEEFKAHWEQVTGMSETLSTLLNLVKVIETFEQSSSITQRLIHVIEQRIGSSKVTESVMLESAPRLNDYSIQIAQLHKSTKENPLLNTNPKDDSSVVTARHVILGMIDDKCAQMQKDIEAMDLVIQSKRSSLRGNKVITGILKQAKDIEGWIQNKLSALETMSATENVPIDDVFQWQTETESIHTASKSYSIAIAHFGHQIKRFSPQLAPENRNLIQERQKDIDALWNQLSEKTKSCKVLHSEFIDKFHESTQKPTFTDVEALLTWKSSDIDEVRSEDARSIRSYQSSTFSTRSMIPIRTQRSKAELNYARRRHLRNGSTFSGIPRRTLPDSIPEIPERLKTPDYSGYATHPHIKDLPTYKPDPTDELDLQVARLINRMPQSVKVRKATDEETTNLNSSKASRTSSSLHHSKSSRASVIIDPTPAPFNSTLKRSESRGQFYWFGEVDPRKYFCKLLPNGTVMVRVGGGYEQLQEFLDNRTKFVKGIPQLQSFQPNVDDLEDSEEYF
jgi:hypothetical protein